MRDLQSILEKQNFASLEEANAFIGANLLGKPIPRPEATTPFERAMQLVDEALETDSDARRGDLARQALEVSPDIALAWVILAEVAKSPLEALDLYIKAVEAGQRAVGDELPTLAREGHLWLSLEGRPLLVAKLELAFANWRLGDRRLAIEQAWEILSLNRNDNQGVRSVLLTWLLRAGSLDQIERLIAQYPEESSASWLFDIALHRFRTEGHSARASSALRAATRVNPFVTEYLRGKREPPMEIPSVIGWGDESEAVAYVQDALAAWLDTPETVQWLEAEARTRGGRKTKGARRPRG
jgi:tetratricopeptide (TPR) repeat protein